MAVQTKLVAECGEEKRARWEVAREYYEAINVRIICCMAFEPVFKSCFVTSAAKALATGVRGVLVEGRTCGLASDLIYLIEALLFSLSAVFIAEERWS